MIYQMLEDKYSLDFIEKLKFHSLQHNLIIIEAMKFAKSYHSKQLRKSGEPYYVHPIAVAELVLGFSQDPEIIAAALLHDVLEDTSASMDILKYYFGNRIASIVYKLTRERENGIKLTLQEILDDLITINDSESALIKLMDRLHNLSTIEYMAEQKIIETIKETYDARFLGLAAQISLEIEKRFISILEKYNNTLTKDTIKNPNFFHHDF